jgi:hypothetical protein
MGAGVTGFVERREERLAAARRRAEDLQIAVSLALRHIPGIDAFITALDAAGGGARFVKALRAELALRRGGRL